MHGQNSATAVVAPRETLPYAAAVLTDGRAVPFPSCIDVHTHLLPPQLPRWADRFGYGGFIGLEPSGPCRARMVRDDGRFFREVEHNLWDPQARLAEMAATGVSVQVLSTVPVMFCYWAQPRDGLQVAQFLNDHLAQTVQAHPRRFVGLGTLPMQDPDLAIAELERCVGDLGLAGVQVGTLISGPRNDWNLSEEALFPVFQRAAELGASIFVHPWNMMGEATMPKYWLPWLVGMPAECSRALCSLIFSGVFERLPSLRVCMAHGGGSFAATVGRIAHGFSARPDLCAVDNPVSPLAYLGRFWVDSLVHDADALRLVLGKFGADKVAVGSDYPFPLGEAQPGELVRALQLGAETEAKLCTGNALQWLGLDENLQRRSAT